MKTSSLVAILGASSAVLACLSPFERRGKLHVGANDLLARRDANEGKIPIGQGDRFNGGAITPKGLGTTSNPNFTTYLNEVEVRSAAKALAREFKNVEYFEAPFKTYENRTIFGLKVGGKKSNSRNNKGYEAFIQGGSHARERGSTDHPIYFTADLLWAAREKKGLTYGGVVFSPKEVQTAIDVGFVLIPNVNPDGSAWDQATDTCWRKNRNPASSTPGDENSIGVDLNRNYDIAWNATEYMAPETIWEEGNLPNGLTYPGLAPFSEPETKNVRWAFDTFPDLGWSTDVHSIAGMVLYGSAIDTVQTHDKNMNWRNPAYNDIRAIYPDRPDEDAVYKEFMEEKDLGILARTAARMVDRMQEAALRDWGGGFLSGGEYPSGQLAQWLGAGAGGTALDYTYSRHFVDKKKKKVLSLALEFGLNLWLEEDICPFYPTVEQYAADMAVVSSGLVQMLLSAATY